MTGRLVLVGTPIGNLGDLAPRAAEVLAEADAIVCEDTRRTRGLLSHLGIPAAGRLRSLPAHDEAARADAVVELLVGGATVALVTDAGMPGISDPGALLVDRAVAVGVEIDTVPGPTALATALVLSGLPADRFVFEGFLPRKGAARRDLLALIATDRRTTVLYESPRRVGATLADLAAACGPDRPAALARELTKVHQEVLRAPLGELAERYRAVEPRGECVIVVGPAAATETAPDAATIDAALRAALATGASTRDAATAVAAELHIARRLAYERAVELRAD